jgi:hypothetical protein
MTLQQQHQPQLQQENNPNAVALTLQSGAFANLYATNLLTYGESHEQSQLHKQRTCQVALAAALMFWATGLVQEPSFHALSIKNADAFVGFCLANHVMDLEYAQAHGALSVGQVP